MFTRIQRQNTDIVLAGIKGLPRVLELDNGILRAVRKHFDELTGAETAVHVLTLQHSDYTSSPYFDNLADEPILVVTFLKLSVGGSSYRRAWRENNGHRGELKIGSITLEMFMELSDVIRKSPIVTGRIWDIDARRLPRGCQDLGRVIMEMGQSVHKLEFISKARGPNGTDRWYGLLKSSTGTDGRRDVGLLSIRERNIPKLNDRPESRVKGLDASNLEPMEELNEKPMTLGNSTLVVQKVNSLGGQRSSEWNRTAYPERRGKEGYGIPPATPDPYARRKSGHEATAPPKSDKD
jgi:hypothetical protein